VDNDFAAVLIRQYDAKGLIESPETRDAPLVSAEWHAVDLPGQIDLESVVHVAKSDEFVLRLGEEDGLADGQLKVWLIYADFLGSSPPRTWPAKREWAGGILAYFEIDWQVSADGESRGLVRPKRPEESTRFDWAQWVERTPGVDQSAARVRLFNETE